MNTALLKFTDSREEKRFRRSRTVRHHLCPNRRAFDAVYRHEDFVRWDYYRDQHHTRRARRRQPEEAK